MPPHDTTQITRPFLTAVLSFVVSAALLATAPQDANATLPPPSFAPQAETDMSATIDGIDVDPSTQISADTPGCVDPFFPDEYDGNDHSCEVVSLMLSRNGRLVRTGPAGFQDRQLGVNDFTLVWDCHRTGTYRWLVTYVNSSYAPTGQPFVASAGGSFGVPRCVQKVARRVDRGTVADHALQETENLHDNQFVSQVRCNATGAGASQLRASRWVCRATRNSTIKVCVDQLRFRFWKRDEWRRLRNGYDLISQKTLSCRLF